MSKLTKEEKELLSSYERGEWKSARDSKKNIKRIKGLAKLALTKDKRVNLRISSQILEALQLMAIQNGIPYQTYMASILYRYVNGSLTESRNDGRNDRSSSSRSRSNRSD